MKNMVKSKYKIIKERNKLAIKKFDHGLTAQESMRLNLIRWQLDKIDDANYGESLDLLEQILINLLVGGK
jgi:hypothetical protein